MKKIKRLYGKVEKLYYHLTKYLPRPLPQTDEEFNHLKDILMLYYGLEDHPKYIYTLASQMMAGSPTSLYRSYGVMINAVRKLNTAAVVQSQRELASALLKARLEAQMKEMQDAFKEEESKSETADVKPEWSDVPNQPHPVLSDGPLSVQTELQVLPPTPERVVSISGTPGL